MSSSQPTISITSWTIMPSAAANSRFGSAANWSAFAEVMRPTMKRAKKSLAVFIPPLTGFCG